MTGAFGRSEEQEEGMALQTVAFSLWLSTIRNGLQLTTLKEEA